MQNMEFNFLNYLRGGFLATNLNYLRRKKKVPPLHMC